ncbi:hypothetical protein BH09PSE2_BH09PSE2_22590 [soil metagenome]
MSLRHTFLALTATACVSTFAGAALAQTPAATPASAPATGAAYTPITSQPSQTIAAVLASSGQFSTLLKAATATGLAPVLSNAGSLTVFAPTDAAFAALPAGALDNLMKPEKAADLQKAVAYHIVNTKILSASAKGHVTKAASAAGPELYVDGTGDTVKVNDATVIQADVQTSNGVIHVIDKVIMPGFTPPTPPPEAAATTTTTETTATKSTTTKAARKKK